MTAPRTSPRIQCDHGIGHTDEQPLTKAEARRTAWGCRCGAVMGAAVEFKRDEGRDKLKLWSVE